MTQKGDIDGGPIELVAYEDWMFEGAVALELRAYGKGVAATEASLHWRLAHPLARRHGIAVAAIRGREVVGLQTWMPWFYRLGAREFRSAQSGGSVIHESCRRQGLFLRLLKFGAVLAREREVDFFTGFPIVASYGALLRDGWAKVAEPRWWIAPGRPDAALSAAAAGASGCHGFGVPVEGCRKWSTRAERRFVLSEDPEFVAWRYGGSRAGDYRSFHHDVPGGTSRFIVRMGRRRGFSEALLVDWQTTCRGVVANARALLALRAALFRSGLGAVVTLLLHSGRERIMPRCLLAAGFVPTWKTARFLVKDLRDTPSVFDPECWTLMARDMDTG
ncbi:MAG: hypothetical protein IT373_14185 [Polyangiaceae bacterium]|nr:hypothetical protein [Polyangiaceae bacterium]